MSSEETGSSSVRSVGAFLVLQDGLCGQSGGKNGKHNVSESDCWCCGSFWCVCVCVLPVSVLLMLGGDTISTAPSVIPECTTGASTEGELSS